MRFVMGDGLTGVLGWFVVSPAFSLPFSPAPSFVLLLAFSLAWVMTWQGV